MGRYLLEKRGEICIEKLYIDDIFIQEINKFNSIYFFFFFIKELN